MCETWSFSIKGKYKEWVLNKRLLRKMSGLEKKKQEDGKNCMSRLNKSQRTNGWGTWHALETREILT